MKKIRELYSDRCHYCKDKIAIDKNDFTVNPRSQYAVAWCLLGAIDVCYDSPEDRIRVMKMIKEEIQCEITTWNDFVASYEDVVKLVNKLDV